MVFLQTHIQSFASDIFDCVNCISVQKAMQEAKWRAHKGLFSLTRGLSRALNLASLRWRKGQKSKNIFLDGGLQVNEGTFFYKRETEKKVARPASFQWTEPALFVSSGAFGAISSGKRKDVLKTYPSKLVAMRTAKTRTASDFNVWCNICKKSATSCQMYWRVWSFENSWNSNTLIMKCRPIQYSVPKKWVVNEKFMQNKTIWIHYLCKFIVRAKLKTPNSEVHSEIQMIWK